MLIEDVRDLFRRLEEFDTPTICNALEMVDSRFFDRGYTTEGMVCLNGPRPRVGHAYTATMRHWKLRPLRARI